MVFVLLALWTFAAILLTINRKNEPTRWAALAAFAGGVGGLSLAITDSILPYINHLQISSPAVDSILLKIHGMGLFICHTGLPYCFLMFAISYSDLFRHRAKAYLARALLIPIILMSILSSITSSMGPNYRLLFFWSVPLLFVGLYFLTYSFLNEKNLKRKRNRLYTNLIVFPPILFQVVAYYTLNAFFDVFELWRLMPFVIALSLATFLIFSVKYGVFGVRLKFEKDCLDGRMSAVFYGVNVLNHTIKNEIGKIRIVADQILMLATLSKQEIIADEVGVVLDSTKHMLEMVTRIQKQSQEIVLKEGIYNITSIFNKAILTTQVCLTERNIGLQHSSSKNMCLICDPVQLQETFQNIIVNAAEAMEAGGTLIVSIMKQRKYIAIQFTDNGKGISKNELAYLFDPFYSTKQCGQNYGLGLTYCYNVMKQHGGAIVVISELGVGTTVELQLPNKRLLSGNLPLAEVMDVGSNQSYAG